MIRLSSNFSDLLSLKFECERDITPVLTKAAEAIVPIVKNRVLSGIGSEGQRLVTKSAKRKGDYSGSHADKREGAGLAIRPVTLSFRGDTAKNYQVIEVLPNKVSVGFLDDEAVAIAEQNEAYFGPAYFASESEKGQQAQNIINEVLLNI